ncbi:hypothetical protein Esi_0315_0016 [Ectocarpus siliculosus]|uniref:Uncharacterized protein n=1 Tax=Ectocarpus siliculosus TaxID=2880 RepID=D7FWV8_ECTSI|nr:hypothetical protein Esi_0315_0016 [Ectocarpus siliculosus]|eukprot:CBJ32196.1 hypothetical protein Esi_0315_0016 [Ectocarpus siliculosus]
MTTEPCEIDCTIQNYPTFPYGPGAESLFSKVLPFMLSAMVVAISWLAGRFIDKIEVSTPGAMTRVKSGTIGQSVKRSASHDKSDSHGFHSNASRGVGRSGVKMLEGVQELDGISARDDEQNRLYNEEYGSQASQEDGERYDALGDSPGAQGPSSQGPRSPSVYSHFSQSVFSQSAYGPSAYGPSQRSRASGSIYGHSQYGDGSSLGGSQYPGPVPSHFGASQMSSDRTSYHASNGGGSSNGAGGIPAGVNAGRGGGEIVAHGVGHRQIPAPYGGGGDGTAAAGGAARMLPPPTYNPNPYPHRSTSGVPRGHGLGGSGLVGVGMGGAAATAAAAAAAAATAAAVAHEASGFNLGSPPPYSQAASTLPKEPRPSVDSRPSLDGPQAWTTVDGQERRPNQALPAAAAAAAARGGSAASGFAPSSSATKGPVPAGAAPASSGRSGGGSGSVSAPGPSSGFGESESEPGSVPSTFRG